MSDDVATEGLQYILETCFSDAQTPPASFYMGLCEDDTILETADLAGLAEIAQAGYSRDTVASDSTDFTSAGTGTDDRKVTTKTITFTATATWNGAVHVFLATTPDDSGKLICFAALSVERFLVDGDTLQVSIVITLVG